MGRGTYTLLIELLSGLRLEFGAAGERALSAGSYAYTGSALGPGGFSRLDRHREVATGARAVQHWHIDYLLGAEEARVVGDVRSADADIECAVAQTLADAFPVVAGIGASDCNCHSHLVHAADETALRDAARAAHDAARLDS